MSLDIQKIKGIGNIKQALKMKKFLKRTSQLLIRARIGTLIIGGTYFKPENSRSSDYLRDTTLDSVTNTDSANWSAPLILPNGVVILSFKGHGSDSSNTIKLWKQEFNLATQTDGIADTTLNTRVQLGEVVDNNAWRYFFVIGGVGVNDKIYSVEIEYKK